MKYYKIASIIEGILRQVVVIALIYYLSPVEYGYFSLMLVVANVMFIMTSGWNNALILNFGTKEHIEKGHIKEVFLTRIFLLLLSLIITISLYFLSYDYIFYFIKNKSYVPLVLVYFAGDVFFNLVGNLFYAKDKNNLQATLNLIPKTIQILYVIFYFSDLYNFIFLSFFTNFSVFIIILILYLKDEYKVKSQIKKDNFTLYFKFSLLQFLNIGSVYLINWGDNFSLSYFSIDMRIIGNYNLGYKMFLGFNTIFALLSIVIPKIVYKYKKSGEYSEIKLFLIKRKYFALILLFLYLAALYVLKYLILILDKSEYLNSVYYASFLILAFIIMCYTEYIVPVILNTPFYSKVQYTVVVQAILNLILNMFFVYFYGIYGVLIGTTIACLYKYISLEYYFRKYVKPYLKGYAKC